MIFGTVGTHTAPFDRLVAALDAFAGQTSERVLMQIGTATHIPANAEWFRMTSSEDFLACLRSARVVVTHAADSVLDAIAEGKPVVAVPRRRMFREHIDDHQVHLGRALAAKEQVVLVEDVATLNRTLTGALAAWSPPEYPHAGRQDLVRAIRRGILSST